MIRPLFPYLWMLLGSLAFALMSSLASSLSTQCDWQIIALARTSLACLFAAILAKAGGAKLIFRGTPMLWVRSLAGSISLACGFFAFTHLPVSDVITLTNMFPIWVAVLSWPMLGEIPSRDVWVAMLFGIAGVVVLQQPHLNDGNIASYVALFSSFTSGVALIGLHRLHGMDPRSIVVHFSAVAFMVVLGALCIFPRKYGLEALGDPLVIVKLIALGAMATCGQLLLTLAFATGQPAKVAVVGLSQVGFGIVLEILIWHRQFTWMAMAGIALVVAPTAWVMTRRAKQA